MLNYGMREMKSKNAILGSIVHSLSFGVIELIENGMIVYSNSGIIDRVVDLDKVNIDRTLLNQFRSVVDYTGKVILPGFVDSHCHAPQYVFSGTGMDLPLLAWLEKYTFPCEARFGDVNFARTAYEKSIRRHLKCGTTFASYFATIHNSGGKVLVDVINEVGQRAFVGKVSMDRNSPDFYIEETIRGCEDAEEFARYVLAMNPIGAAFLNAVDNGTPITTSALLAQSHNSVVLTRPVINNNGQIGVTSGSSGVKRPRSVSAGDEDGVFHMTSSRPVASAGAGNLSSGNNASIRPRAISDMENYILEELDYSRPRSGSSSSSMAPSNALHSPNSANLSNSSSNTGDDCSSSTSETVSTLLNKPFTPLVLPCVTPRFVPTCTGEMLGMLGAMAAKYGLPIQSHLSESTSEIAWVKELHPDCPSYAAVYQKYGLLTEHCIMGHCCHSDSEEQKLLAQCGTAMVHCASSNFTLDSGVLDVHGCLANNVKLGLGTDVAGGYSPSMLDAMRQSIIASKVILFESRGDLVPKLGAGGAVAGVGGGTGAIMADAAAGDSKTTSECSTSLEVDAAAAVDDSTSKASVNNAQQQQQVRTLNYKEAFHLATMGGAQALSMGDVVGNFLPGKKLDCLVMDPAVENGPFDVFDGEGPSEWFQKFLFLGDDRNIVVVYVDGRRVI